MTAIDLGSRKAVMGKYMKAINQHLNDGVEIIPNGIGQKETHVCIAWVKDKERLFGYSAYNQVGRNLVHSFIYMTRLIGLTKEDEEQIRKEQKFCLFDLQVDKQPNSKLFVLIENQRFYIEQILAAFLKKMFTGPKKHPDDEESKDGEAANDKDVFVTYPSFATEKQRQALHDACVIADIGRPKLTCESTAILVDYAS